ncbi:hypothetical protein [Cerasicoccus frondis]|uniref:hypothetical protein n=1 Tax=Cerasicoccus frondis TaxID=490090 RepID=UPI002852C833|nr:hypothetical protein [Cerasicoccus frondis]
MNAPLEIIEDYTLVDPPGIFSNPFVWLGIFIGAIVIGFVAYKLMRYRQATLSAPPPPEKSARQDLQLLASDIDLLSAREFALKISLILRVYIERRFDLNAPKFSTEEFLYHAAHSPLLPEEQHDWTNKFLLRCDQTKYALADMERQTKHELFDAVQSFVKNTTPPH